MAVDGDQWPVVSVGEVASCVRGRALPVIGRKESPTHRGSAKCFVGLIDPGALPRAILLRAYGALTRRAQRAAKFSQLETHDEFAH